MRETEQDSEYPHLLRANDIQSKQVSFSHPWNPESEVTLTLLSRKAGLVRTGVSIVRIAPGKESFAYHLHHREEEWIYIMAGRGIALIDDHEYELGPGDFVAFPTPSVPHNLSNPFDTELVYLMGGESAEHEIADFPKLGKRMVRLGESMEVYNLADGEPFTVPDPG